MYTQQSELSAWLGKLLLVFSPLPKIVIALLVSIIVASVTEVMSNIATTTLFLPVLKQLVSQFIHHLATPLRNTAFYLPQAINLHIHPLYLMIPAAVSASFAFMIPMSTPPNAIAFSYGYLKVYDMVSILIIHILTVVATMSLYSFPLFCTVGIDRHTDEPILYHNCGTGT